MSQVQQKKYPVPMPEFVNALKEILKQEGNQKLKDGIVYIEQKALEEGIPFASMALIMVRRYRPIQS